MRRRASATSWERNNAAPKVLHIYYRHISWLGTQVCSWGNRDCSALAEAASGASVASQLAVKSRFAVIVDLAAVALGLLAACKPGQKPAGQGHAEERL